MKIVSALPVLALFLVPNQDEISVCRHRFADGKGSKIIDLDSIQSRNRVATRILLRHRPPAFQDRPHRSGLAACRSTRKRKVKLANRTPARFRGATFYFTTTRGKRIPPRHSAVFVLDADSMKDVAALAKRIRRPVSLATADFARMFGVTCRNARVTVSKDGHWSTVREESQ